MTTHISCSNDECKGMSHNTGTKTYINIVGCDSSRKPFTSPILDTSAHTFNRNLISSRLLTNDGVTSCSTLNPNATPFVPLSDIMCENGALAALLIIILISSAFLISEIINISSKHENDVASPRVILSNLRINNINKIIIGYLNINSIRNKFEYLKYLIVENIDVLLISESKHNNTFPQCQCLLDGFHTPYREGRTDKGGGLLDGFHTQYREDRTDKGGGFLDGFYTPYREDRTDKGGGLLDGFHTPYREGRTDKGGGLPLYVSCRNIKFNFCTTIEAIVVEIILSHTIQIKL